MIINDHYLDVAKEAVREAFDIAVRIHASQNWDQIIKPDNSPVTLADFCCQFVILRKLKSVFPKVPFVAEEEASMITEKMCTDICKLLNTKITFQDIREAFQSENVKDPECFWTLDPIDGTRGFILPKSESAQYCICLALMGKVDDGFYEPIIGILGCPNLKTHFYIAVKNRGVFNLQGDRLCVNVLPALSIKDLRITVPRVASRKTKEFFSEVGFKNEIISMDSQTKYSLVADGAADVYIRALWDFPTGYGEKIWDHAAGTLIVREAGGNVLDFDREPIKFTYGKYVSQIRGGIVALRGGISQRVQDELFKLLKDFKTA